jgi:hypothetical protein
MSIRNILDKLHGSAGRQRAILIAEEEIKKLIEKKRMVGVYKDEGLKAIKKTHNQTIDMILKVLFKGDK